MDFKDIYFSAWQSAWQFHKKWSGNKGSDREWEAIVKESGQLFKKYEDTENAAFMKGLILTVISELERVGKQRQTQEDKENEKK